MLENRCLICKKIEKDSDLLEKYDLGIKLDSIEFPEEYEFSRCIRCKKLFCHYHFQCSVCVDCLNYYDKHPDMISIDKVIVPIDLATDEHLAGLRAYLDLIN